MKKSFWFPLLSSLITVIFLYLVGFIFNLSIFEFKIFQNENQKDGLILDAEIALLPIVIGFYVGFIVDRILKIEKKSNR